MHKSASESGGDCLGRLELVGLAISQSLSRVARVEIRKSRIRPNETIRARIRDGVTGISTIRRFMSKRSAVVVHAYRLEPLVCFPKRSSVHADMDTFTAAIAGLGVLVVISQRLIWIVGKDEVHRRALVCLRVGWLRRPVNNPRVDVYSEARTLVSGLHFKKGHGCGRHQLQTNARDRPQSPPLNEQTLGREQIHHNCARYESQHIQTRARRMPRAPESFLVEHETRRIARPVAHVQPYSSRIYGVAAPFWACH